MTVRLSPVGNDAPFLDSSGNPLSGGLMYFYTAQSSTPQDTYTTSAGNVANANPVVLDSGGYPATAGNVVEIWFTSGVNYKAILKTAAGVTVWTRDNLSGINDTTVSIDEWVSGASPTYVSATSFTLVGDQTSTYHVGRRLKSTNSGGTVYSTILSTTFGALTTVTVANDAAGVLDAGLSAISYGLISAVNPSIDADMVNRKGAAVTSAATTNIWGIVGDFVHITGSTGPITSLGTAPYAGAQRTVIFDSTPTLTYNATTLLIPGGASITAAAGDRMVVRADTTANMIITQYTRADGTVINATTQEYADLLQNITIVPSRGANAETIALKTKAGTDPTAADPIKIAFRDATIGTGGFTTLTVTAATSIVVSSGSTLGMVNNILSTLALVAFNDGGTFRLGIINISDMTAGCQALRDDLLYSSTAEGGAGAADSANVIYTGTAVASKAMRVLGYLNYTLAAVGTWGTAPSKIQNWGRGMRFPPYRSPAQTITANGTLSLTHGLGIFPDPKSIGISLINVTGELGYVTGEVIPVDFQADPTNATTRGAAVKPTITTLEVKYANQAATFVLVNFGSGAIGAATNANWKAIFTADVP